MEGEEDAYGRRQRGTPQLKRTHSQMQQQHRNYRNTPPYLRLRSDSPSSPSSTTTTPTTAFYTPQSVGSGGASNREGFVSPFQLHLPPSRAHNPISISNPRYPGDGFDYRRPIMTTATPSQNSSFNRGELAVIDLTGADEDVQEPQAPLDTSSNRATFVPARGPPRFPRDIIDLSGDTPPRREREESRHAPAAPPLQQPSQPDSPEVLFVSSRPRTTPRPSPPVRREDGQSSFEIDLTASDVDEMGNWAIQLFDEATHPPTPRSRAGQYRSRQAQRIERLLSGPLPPRHEPNQRGDHLARLFLRETLDFVNRANLPPRGGGRGNNAGAAAALDIDLPGQLNFATVGFDLGLDRSNTSSPTYQAPPKAPHGFTRSPQEDDVLMCPNCAAELCTGEDDEKRQVWVLKGCGHVYCGTCAKNRSKSAAKARRRNNGKDKEPLRGAAPLGMPFKQCVVEGCEAKASSRMAMVQLFL